MKTLIITSALFLSIFSSNSFAWNKIFDNTYGLNNLYFLNSDTGFVVGSQGAILKTINGGTTWTQQNSGTSQYLRGCYFINSNVGFAVGGNINSLILKTINGGATWDSVPTLSFPRLICVYFTDLNNGYCVGNSGTILKTTDGGNTWINNNYVTTSQLQSIVFINNNTGFICGSYGIILKTIDAGQNWAQITSGTTSNLNSIYFANSNIGYIGGTSKTFLKTTDGGNTWSVSILNIPYNSNITSVFFISPNIGYITSGEIYKTTDSGLSWRNCALPQELSYSATKIIFTNSNIGYAIGGPIIYKTNIGGGYSDYDSLFTNNINARFYSFGAKFWDMFANSKFEVPKGSKKTSLFVSELWVGGKDSLDSLHTIGGRYRSAGNDLVSGPIMNESSHKTDDELWNRLWRVSRNEIEFHVANWSAQGYVMPTNIAEWPGNGDTAKGQLAVIAPYFDYNNDGRYTPELGDYPNINGDEAIFYIVNDSTMLYHMESKGEKLGLEIRVMAYAFNCPNDSALWNTLFVNYEIINRSHNTYDSTFVGEFTDFDLGFSDDDYVACDVERSSFYVYNADDMDGDGNGHTYGTYPPAQSITFLGGPYMNNDGSDYGSSGIPDGCDESINGLGFNDGIIDNERLGLSSFMYFINTSGVQGDPNTAIEYYNYLKSYWRNGTHASYGGFGYGDTIPTNFIYPENSDTCGWGIGSPQPYWGQTGTPYDLRGIGSIGPFTFKPGSTQYFDIAYVFGRDYVNPDHRAGIAVMKQRIDSVRKYFITNTTPCGNYNIGIKENVNNSEVNIYPNPASNYFEIESKNIVGSYCIKVFSIEGKKIKELITNENNVTISTDNLNNGLYIVEVSSQNRNVFKKIVISKQ